MLFHSAYPGSVHSDLGLMGRQSSHFVNFFRLLFNCTARHVDEAHTTQVRNIIHASEIPRKAVAVGCPRLLLCVYHRRLVVDVYLIYM